MRRHTFLTSAAALLLSVALAAQAPAQTLRSVGPNLPNSAIATQIQAGDGSTVSSWTRGVVLINPATGQPYTSSGGGGAGGTEYTEDSPHTSGALGTFGLGVRSDTAASLANATGDYTASIYDSLGRLWVNGSGVTQPVSDAGGSITVDGTVAVSGSVATTGTYWQATQPVSAAALPLPTGAASAANQTAVQGTFGATVANRMVQYDASGNAIDFSAASNIVGIYSGGLATSGQQGILTQCAATTAAPTYINGTTNYLSCDLTGGLRVSGAGGGGGGGDASSSNQLATIGTKAPGTAAASSQLAGAVYTSGGVSLTTGQQAALQVDSLGQLKVTTASALETVQGVAAGGATSTGNPVKVGGVYNTSMPTYTAGQQAELQTDAKGSLKVASVGSDGTTAVVVQVVGADGDPPSKAAFYVNGRNQMFSGTNWDRARGISSALNTGVGTAAVHIAPTAAATGGLTPVTNTAAASSLVVKASAGNLYGFRCTNTSASAIWVLLLNATSAPADGAVTPLGWWQVAANADLNVSYGNVPAYASTGHTLVISSTGPFTKTAATSGACAAQVQ